MAQNKEWMIPFFGCMDWWSLFRLFSAFKIDNNMAKILEVIVRGSYTFHHIANTPILAARLPPPASLQILQ